MVHNERDITAAIAELEGYLRCETDIAEAQQEAETFADRMPWLTSVQREELVRLYTDDRLALTRRYLRRIVTRCAELRSEYTARYETLRNRLIRFTTATTLGALALTGCALLLSRTGR